MDKTKQNFDVLKGLEPANILKHFVDITGIDRASGREEALAAYIKDLAVVHGLRYYSDKDNNVVVYVPASKGKEDIAPICIQGHLDMVALNSDNKDFDTSQIEFCVKEGKAMAKGTTAGFDNGLGLGMAAELLTNPDLVHGPLELLFTTDEEVGMNGAKSLDPTIISARNMINVDSEDFGEVTIGCAGGGRLEGIFHVDREKLLSEDVTLYNLKISGLHGGHSGGDIDKGRANAIILMARVLSDLASRVPIRLVSYNGGARMNAIPNEAIVELVAPGNYEWICDFISANKIEIAEELRPIEDFNLEIWTSQKPYEEWKDLVFTEECQSQLLLMLQLLPNGPIKMDSKNLSVIQSSDNIATIKTTADEIIISSMYRSSSDSHKKYLGNLIIATFKNFQATMINLGSEYPAWKPTYSFPLLESVKMTFREMFGEEIKVVVVHGGLECALFSHYWPDMEIVSFGPTIKNPHSVNEEVALDTIEKTWNLLLKILADFDIKNQAPTT